MIEVLANRYDVIGLFDEITISQQLDVTLVLTQELGLTLPSLTITFKYEEESSTVGVDQGKIFTFSLNDVDYEFKVTQYKFINGVITINSLLNAEGFLDTRRQMAIDGTSIQALQAITEVPVVTSLTTDDQQVWIQDNITDKEFARNVLAHQASEVLILSWISMATELNVRSVSEITQDDPTQLGSEPNQIKPSRINLSSATYEFENIVTNHLGLATQSGATDSYNNNNIAPAANVVLIDMGNTHLSYFESVTRNAQLYLAFYRRNFNTRFSDIDELITPGDHLRLENQLNIQGQPDWYGIVDASLIVSKSVTTFSKDGSTVDVIMNEVPQ